MKLSRKNTQATTNVSNTHNYGIADMSIVMDILTRLYSHPIQTLVQEYICNGRDANREVKSKKPIHITAPTRFSSEFIVRDFGPGLSQERINKIFVLYGASTKRDSNGQTGGFGIGAKSAWAYTDSFIVTSFYRGQKSVYVCHKSGGQGNMDLISQEKTNEPNGVEIKIPVNNSDLQRFENAIRRAVYFWQNEKPTSNLDLDFYDGEFNTFEVTKHVPHFLDNNNSYRSVDNFIIIDGIPYTCNFLNECNIDKIDTLIKSNTKLFFIPNGKVEIAPSREELIDSNISKAALKIIIDKEAIKLKTKITELFKDCNIDFDKIKLINKYNGIYKLNTVLPYTKDRLTQWGSRNRVDGWTHKDFTDDSFIWCSITQDNTIDKNKYKGFNSYDQMFYIDTEINGKPESPKHINDRIRHSQYNEITIVDHTKINNFDHHKKELNILPISSLSLPPKQKKVKKTNDNSKINIHRLGRYNNFISESIYLNSLTNVYYVEYDKRKEFKDLLIFIKNRGKIVIAANKSVVKKLEKTKRGQHINKFIEAFQPTDKLIDSYLHDKNELRDRTNSFIAQGLKIKGVITLPELKFQCYIPPQLKEIIEKTTRYQNYIKTLENNNKILDKLPLLPDYYRIKYKLKEWQEYVNWKLGV